MRRQVEVLLHFTKTAVIATLLYTPFDCLYIVLLIAIVSYLCIAFLLSFLAQINSTRTVTVIAGSYSKSSSACLHGCRQWGARGAEAPQFLLT